LPAKDTVLVFKEGAARERGLFYGSGSAMTFGIKQYPTSLGQNFPLGFRPFGRLIRVKIVVGSKIQGIKRK